MQTKSQKQYIGGSSPNFISKINRILAQGSISIPPENVRKLFRGVQKWDTELKWVTQI